jgi:monoamine oxidase
MPTIFTALRARHDDVPARRSAPTAGAGQGVRKLPILASQIASVVGSRPGAAPKPSMLMEGHAPTEISTRARVIVVGAGFAGLCAAYELMGLGFDIRVYEARARVGGRVESLHKFIPGRVMEGGAELIGSNHPLWLLYRQHFDLRFSKVEDYPNSPIRVDNRTLSFEDTAALNTEMKLILGHLTDLAETVVDPFEPWTNRDAIALDGRSLTDWLRNSGATRLCQQAIAEQLAADNGIPAAQQSLLGVLAMIKGGGLDRYWSDTELYRCEGGNDQLAECFKVQLNVHKRRVFTDSPVTEIERQGNGVLVTVKGRRPITADHVILAIPPSMWHTINFKDRPLAARLAKPPKMGHNVKYLMRLRTRFWQDFASSPTLTEMDGPVDITWETTEAGPAARGKIGMVAFSGARHADECGRWRPAVRRAKYLKSLEAPYPLIGREFDDGEFKDWPREPWSLGSYYFPRRHEVTRWGPFWKDGYKGWLHFCGEHTSFAFAGYMEGALSSGFRLARRLAATTP